MQYWQPQSTSYGGALETVHLTDYGLAHLAQQAEGAAHVGGFDQPFRDYVSLGLGLGGTDHPANVNTIQTRVAALEYSLANGGSLMGIAGADHGHYIGSLAIAGSQFAAPDYSNAPDPLTGGGFSPAQFTYADVTPPAWTNAYSDVSLPIAPSASPVLSGDSSAISTSRAGGIIASGGTFSQDMELGTSSTFDLSPAVELPAIESSAPSVFLGQSSTVDMHLDLSPDVQEKLARISSTFKGYNLSGGAVDATSSSVSIQSLPNLVPKASRDMTPAYS